MRETILLLVTLMISISGLIYELLEGTISSYFLGDSIYHFSLVIGIFMSAMGIGAWVSRYIRGDLVKSFIYIQLSLAIIGGFSSALLFYAFAVWESYDIFLYLETISIGILIGMEIPLIIRILQQRFELKMNVSNVLTADYIGALVASILFPIFFLPHLGLIETALFFGAMNAFCALLVWRVFRKRLDKKILYSIIGVFLIIFLGWFKVSKFTSFIEYKLYNDTIIYAEHTPYQSITITGNRGRVKLFINGALQFDSIDEYRYHESLVHPAMSATKSHRDILIIGGGDGLALREILKYPDVKSATLVDIDPAMTKLFSTNRLLRRLNGDAFCDKRVEVAHQDAWKFLEKSKKLYDIIIIDLPDPNNPSLSRLYSKKFYTMVSNHLSRAGVAVVQSTSPLFAQKAYWCIVHTVEATGAYTIPYHSYVPSFGEWGFTLFGSMPLRFDFSKLPKDLRYFSAKEFKAMRSFAKDMGEVDTKINTIFEHPLLRYYTRGWEKWYR